MTESTQGIGFRRGFMFVLSSPSGAGKTTLSRLLLEQEDNLTMSVSVTTRPMRPGEEEGRDYFFVSPDHFQQMAGHSELLEYATVFGHSYGTPRVFVEKALNAGKDVLFDIDWQGTQQLASRCRDDLVSVFILPPSMAELEMRLRKRAQDSEEVVNFRMNKAAGEIAHWQDYDYVVINRDLDATLARITHILHAERHKRIRQTSLSAFVEQLCTKGA